MEESIETFEQLKVHLLLNLSRCCRKRGQYLEAVSHATTVLKSRPDCLEALHARARAHREAGLLKEAVRDLNEALNLSPQNRDLHRLILKVKEELCNNNDQAATAAGLTVLDDKLKFVDDSASEIGSTTK